MNAPGGQEHDAARLSLGAYVLGGLGPARRAEVERHVAACPACQAELVGLAVVPSLLRRIEPAAQAMTPDTAAGTRAGPAGGAQLGSDRGVPVALLAQVRAERARAARQTRRARVTAAVAGLATAGLAATAALAFTVGPAVRDRPAPAGPTGPAADIAMTPGAAGPSSGRAGLEGRAWGTAVSLELQRLPAGTAFVAWAVADDGRREQAATWGSTPTGSATLSGATTIARVQLDRLEVATVAGIRVLTAAA